MSRFAAASRWAWVVFVAVLLAPAMARGEDAAGYDRWYIVRMAGQHAGWMNLTQKVEGERITSTSSTLIQVGRGKTNVKVSLKGEFVETAAGKPVSMMSIQQMGQMPIESRYEFGATELKVVSKQGEQVSESKAPLPSGEWLTPARMDDELARQLKAGKTEIALRTIDPMSGPTPSTVTRRKIEKASIALGERTITGYKAESVTSSAPTIVSREFLDESGMPVKFDASFGPLKVEFELSDKATAMSFDKAGAPAPEMMVSTFVRPQGIIENPRQASRVVLLLSVPEGELPDLPETGSQRVERLDARTARVTIDVNANHPAPAADAEDKAYLASTSMINAEDGIIRGLVASAVRKAGGDPVDRARAMQRFAVEYVEKKALDTAFASASETARTRTGDCTEHGVLLAAMLRADKIPARVVSGLVYADQFAGEKKIFGYHMWTQALLEVDGVKTWVDLDAALGSPMPNEKPYDATHVAINVSALPEGDLMASMGGLMQVMGRVQIKVEESR